MPVSTFSHGSTLLRGETRSVIVSRWTSTRERIALDEQRVKNHQIQELDGTGLYERSDWPMRPVSVSPTAADSGANNAIVAAAVSEGSHHITDVAAEQGPEVQWLAESGIDDVAAEDLTEQTSSGNGTWVRGRSILLPVKEDEEATQESMKGYDSGTSVSPPPNADEAFATSVRQRQKQEARVRRKDTPTSAQLLNLISAASHSSSSESPPGLGESHTTATQATPVQTNGTTAELERGVPDRNQRTSPVTEEGNAVPIVYERKSSIAKPSPTESSSSRSSTHNPFSNTTQITQNRDCVRYSWQSSQDGEPNRPRINIIKLVSNTASSSAGFPQGEAFGFSVSARGRRIAAYNSARLYILQTVPLPVGISQDFALKRRPLAVEVLDDGTSLAILSDQHTVNIWDLSQHNLNKPKTIKLDFAAFCIALAPMGGLLAVAYENGVEIFSLDPNALPTDRRAVRSQKMDGLSFSQDGSTLLGTTTRINASSSVIINVPVFPAAASGVPTSEELKEAWCSGILHPDNIRNSSHAIFMRENKGTCSDRLFAWNGIADTFGILNTTNLQYGHMDFPVVISPPLSTCGGLGAAIHSVPAIDEQGDTVAMVINDRTIRLYVVPHKAVDNGVSVEAHSIDHEVDPRWGCPFSDARWIYSDAKTSSSEAVQNHVQGRLLVTSPGGVGEQGLLEESVQDVEGGRLIIFDFDTQFAGQPGQTYTLTLGKVAPQMLEEPEINVVDEVALARRRTVNQNRGGGLGQRAVTLGRAATTVNRNTVRSAGNDSTPRRANSLVSAYSGQSEAARSVPDLLDSTEAGIAGTALDEPFLNTVPRSQASLQRAATNAQRHRFQTLEERVHDRMGSESSTAFLPLPEYTEEPNAPLPSRFRAMAGLDAPATKPKPTVATSSNTGRAGMPSGPVTAPASIGEGFRSDDAYAAATAAQTSSHYGNGNTTQRLMPRSLQRAYSNAVGAIGTGPPPRLIGDWQNVSPILPNGQYAFQPAVNGTQQAAAPRTSNEEVWDSISPETPRNNQYRYSTSLLNPPGHQQPQNRQATTSVQNLTSTLPPQQFPNFATNRRVPAHIQAFRDATTSSASSSLFPNAQSSDHVPLMHHHQLEPISTVPHPVTAWHPPAPSSPTSPAPAPSVPRGNVRSPGGTHSRRTSQNGKTAFPPTAKARKLGFFKRKRKGGDDYDAVPGPRPSYDSSVAGMQGGVQCMGGKKIQKKREGSGGCVVM